MGLQASAQANTIPDFLLEASYHLGHAAVDAFDNGLNFDEGFSIINFYGLLVGVPILQSILKKQY